MSELNPPTSVVKITKDNAAPFLDIHISALTEWNSATPGTEVQMTMKLARIAYHESRVELIEALFEDGS